MVPVKATEKKPPKTAQAHQLLVTPTPVLLRQADEPLNSLHLTGILFQITQMAKPIPISVTNAIQAVEFLLKQQTVSDIVEAINQCLNDTITSNIVNNVIMAISPQTANIHTTTEELCDSLECLTKLHSMIEREKEEKEENLQMTAGRIEDVVDMLYESIEDCNNSYKTLASLLEITQDHLNTLSTQLTQCPMKETQPATNPTAHPMYSSITAVHLPPSIDQAVARASIQAKQILLDPTPGQLIFPSDTTNTIIAKKISDILLAICTKNTPKGTQGGYMAPLDAQP
ncbi:hypothetical protein EDB19DRAFT_1826267 [Suillus lakei]|nr:hypothetical protein EDB19DRAFT_1826267 [Suillus lakei]